MKYMKLGSKPDLFQTDGNNIRFVATELATDIIINIGEVKFYLHKFPLLCKSTQLQKLVTTISEETNEEIDISDIPGGPTAFEICVKFCYGMTVTLNAYNVVAARCAAEYLEMHETIEKGNLIYKIHVFLTSSIFRSWKDSIIVLQTTKCLLPWSEDLKIVSHCIDSIALKACIDPDDVEWSYTYYRRNLPSENGLDLQWNGVRKQHAVPRDWWVEDLSELEMECYKRVIMAIKSKGRSPPQVIGEALKAYIYRKLPGFSKDVVNYGDIMRSRTMLETIVWLLPIEKGSVSCGFMLTLLKAAILVDCGENCRKELIKRIGRQLSEASVIDLLIPSPKGEDVAYDVDTVLNIVEEFVMQERGSGGYSPAISEELREVRSPVILSAGLKIAVGNLVDGYLVEVSKDLNLPLSKFVELAEMVPDSLRPVHDGLYRAIDMYLKEHPDITKSEKKKLCSLMDCKKLTVDACMHAVLNEHLPLRLVVQILFFGQVRASTTTSSPNPPGSGRSLLPHEYGASYRSSISAGTTITDDEWDGNSLKSMNLVGGGSERSCGSGNGNKVINGRTKGFLPKKLLSKLWSSRMQSGENSSSDTSESPGGSINPEGSKSTPSRITRHSVS